MRKIIVTGGAGFIGSAVVRRLLGDNNNQVLVIDKLTYAGNLNSLSSVADPDRLQFKKIDICDSDEVSRIFESFQPEIVMHLAAESHVDRSIDGPSIFIQTNIVGTFRLLEVALKYWKEVNRNFLFHHISTDEVFGDLENSGELFTEQTRYNPSSPYSASKASSDHLVRAWHTTYGLPVIITNCSNNYGPYQFPEKLIPLMIISAIEGRPLPVYGKGNQIRDWLFVDDHAQALVEVISRGEVGETYNIGGHNEKTNLEVVRAICEILEKIDLPKPNGIRQFEDLITFVKDRPGHDLRYAIDASKIANELGWKPKETFESGLEKTVKWYLENRVWWMSIKDKSYLKRQGL